VSVRRTTAEIAYEVYEKPLDPVEFDRRVAEILADEEEKRNLADLVAWFTRRYPTVEARLAYVRRHARRRSGA
jgi:hypothetical protein